MSDDHAAERNAAVVRAVMGAGPVLLSFGTATGTVLQVSEEWARWSGVPIAELNERGLLPLVHPDDVATFVAAWNARDEQTGIEWSLRARDASGTYRWLRASARPVRGADGTIVNWVSVFRSADEEMSDLAALSPIAAAVPSMIWVAGSSGETTWVSPLWSRYTGLEAAALLGEGIQATIHPDDTAAVLALWQSGVEEGRDFEIEYRVRRHDGVFRWHLTRATAQRHDDGRVARWFGTTNDIDEQRQLYEREHRVADTLQRALLPGYLPDVAGLTFHAAYRPATTGLLVGGDYYDAFTLPGGAVCVSIGDVSGHGIEAAAAMGKVREAIRIAASTAGSRPDIVLRRANRALFLAVPGTLVTAIFGVIDARTHEFSYASAGHPPALVASHDGNVRVLDGGGLPLGVDEEFTPVVRSATLAAGDTLALYTDGLVENERDLLLGEQRLIGALRGRRFRRAENPADAIVDEVVNGPQRDDVAVLTVGFEGLAVAQFDEQYPAAPASAAAARAALAGFMRRNGVPPARIDDAVAAAGEAIANAVEHAYEHVAGTVRVRVALYGNHAVVDVEDDGRWRAARAAVGTGDDDERLEERGRGLFIIRALTQRTEVDRTPAGTRVRFVVAW